MCNIIPLLDLKKDTKLHMCVSMVCEYKSLEGQINNGDLWDVGMWGTESESEL